MAAATSTVKIGPNKSLPTMIAANVGKNPPFVPEVMTTNVGSPVVGLQETSTGLFAKHYDYFYAGANQTDTINIRIPKPV